MRGRGKERAKVRYAVRVEPGRKVKLGDIDPNENGGLDRKTGEEHLQPLLQELGELQELLYAAGTRGLLIVLQGLDTSGKDGTVRAVFRDANPLGTRVVPFKVPSTLERNHDFLWRVHKEAPERGILTIFNRSHYEDVLAVRIHDLVPKSVWSGRYDHINNFERLLTDSHTLVMKFYLHIDKKEQEARLLERERDVEKAWKLSAADWIDRRSWDRYQSAYEDALSRCSTEHAPWYIVPANRKWYRNLAVAQTVVETLRPYREEWLEALAERGRQELEAIRAVRGERDQA
jgi:PPK2 family polyphosphate:nucleotide phosphotransferase